MKIGLKKLCTITSETPLLNILGGIISGSKANCFEFPTSPQVYNVCQTYKQVGHVGSECSGKEWYVDNMLKMIAKDVEKDFIHGVYHLARNSAEVNLTRGIIATTGLDGGVVVNSVGSKLDFNMMQNFFLTMYKNGAMFNSVVLYVTEAVKDKLEYIYDGFQDMVIGNVNIKKITTDFGYIGVVVSEFAPQLEVLAIDMLSLGIKLDNVLDKGAIFYERIPNGRFDPAHDKGLVFANLGLNHGLASAHGRLFNFICS